MRVVAEGVETPEQMCMLRQKGCDVLQGYLFSAPVDAESAAHLIATGNNALLSLGNSNLSKAPGITTTIEMSLPTNALA